MKNDISAIYNTLGKLQMPPTPDNAKHLAAIYIKLEELFSKAAEMEKDLEEKQDETGGD